MVQLKSGWTVALIKNRENVSHVSDKHLSSKQFLNNGLCYRITALWKKEIVIKKESQQKSNNKNKVTCQSNSVTWRGFNYFQVRIVWKIQSMSLHPLQLPGITITVGRRGE